jgi:hypothetical protein
MGSPLVIGTLETFLSQHSLDVAAASALGNQIATTHEAGHRIIAVVKI